jgi:glycosyltransferase involved in cell wall biosynthesis
LSPATFTVVDGNGPRASVIIPVRNRRDLLGDLLRALDDQSYRDFEVIIVDDGSTDGSDLLASGCAIAGRPVQVLRRSGEGAVMARTAGVAASKGRFLAFTDSDCVPEPQWLASGVAALEAGADLANGPTIPARVSAPLERSVWSGKEGLYPTCNVFYTKEAFDGSGGFDNRAGERFGFRTNDRARGLGFGEDTLLAWRVIREGGRATFAAGAVVHHHVFPADVTESLLRSWMVAAFPALIREVPELRRTLLKRGLILGPRNRLPVYATGAAAVLRSRSLLIACTAWWAYERAKGQRGAAGRWHEKVLALPVEMLLDAVTTAALIAGSIRARSVVL